MRARTLAKSNEKTRSLKESPGREPIVVTTSSGSPGNLNRRVLKCLVEGSGGPLTGTSSLLEGRLLEVSLYLMIHAAG